MWILLPFSAPWTHSSDNRGLKGEIAHPVMTLLIASLIGFSDAWGAYGQIVKIYKYNMVTEATGDTHQWTDVGRSVFMQMDIRI